MDDDEWISFDEASTEIERRLGCSTEDAKARLRAACAEGRIYTMKAPFEYDEELQNFFKSFDEWVEIPSIEWRMRKVDCDGPDDHDCREVVMLRQVQFTDWLDDRAKPQAPNKPRDAAIFKLLNAGLRSPAKMSWKEFCGKVRNEADGWVGQKPAHGFSEKQIRRVVKDMDK